MAKPSSSRANRDANHHTHPSDCISKTKTPVLLVFFSRRSFLDIFNEKVHKLFSERKQSTTRIQRLLRYISQFLLQANVVDNRAYGEAQTEEKNVANHFDPKDFEKVVRNQEPKGQRQRGYGKEVRSSLYYEGQRPLSSSEAHKHLVSKFLFLSFKFSYISAHLRQRSKNRFPRIWVKIVGPYLPTPQGKAHHEMVSFACFAVQAFLPARCVLPGAPISRRGVHFAMHASAVSGHKLSLGLSLGVVAPFARGRGRRSKMRTQTSLRYPCELFSLVGKFVPVSFFSNLREGLGKMGFKKAAAQITPETSTGIAEECSCMEPASGIFAGLRLLCTGANMMADAIPEEAKARKWWLRLPREDQLGNCRRGPSWLKLCAWTVTRPVPDLLQRRPGHTLRWHLLLLRTILRTETKGCGQSQRMKAYNTERPNTGEVQSNPTPAHTDRPMPYSISTRLFRIALLSL